mgnify:CR=1 FL=1
MLDFVYLIGILLGSFLWRHYEDVVDFGSRIGVLPNPFLWNCDEDVVDFGSRIGVLVGSFLWNGDEDVVDFGSRIGVLVAIFLWNGDVVVILLVILISDLSLFNIDELVSWGVISMFPSITICETKAMFKNFLFKYIVKSPMKIIYKLYYNILLIKCK